ncbi:MAG: hypothetical protein MPN21_10635 [Thermoanaerobaculia bacterium]|nr:hypothetical protein [Thermoanaerobaculia bacterium]
MRRRARAGAWVVFLVLAASPIWADARDAFKEAMDRVEEGDWSGVEEKLREAIRLDPAEDKRTFVKDYLPHYWLGVALQEQGDCRAAMTSFEESESQGVAPDSNDAPDLNERMARCRDALDQLEQALQEAQDAAEQAREADASLARMSGSPELAAHWAPFENRRQAALAKLAEAEQLMVRGSSDQQLDPIREAADSASQVTSQLLTIAADARAKAGQVSAASDRAQGDLDEAEAQASAALRAVQALEPLPPELALQAQGLRDLLEEIGTVESSGNSRRMRDLSRQIAESVRQLKNMATPPPTWLTQAAQSFLDQEYAAALAEVEARLGRTAGRPAERLEPRERFHALLLAAAARHQLWVSAGRTGDAAFDQLRADLGEAAGLESVAVRRGGPSLGRASLQFLAPELRTIWAEALVESGIEPPAVEPGT